MYFSNLLKKCISLSIIFSFFLSCTKNVGHLSIENESSQRVLTAKLIVYGKEYVVRDVNPGSTANVKYEVFDDTEYVVIVDIESGKTHKTKGRYVTSGLSYFDKLRIEDKGIFLETSSK